MKESSWLLTTNCSANHANLLVIIALHGSLAIISLSLQETIQSIAHKKVRPHSFYKISCKLLLDHQNRLVMSMK